MTDLLNDAPRILNLMGGVLSTAMFYIVSVSIVAYAVAWVRAINDRMTFVMMVLGVSISLPVTLTMLLPDVWQFYSGLDGPFLGMVYMILVGGACGGLTVLLAIGIAKAWRTRDVYI